MPRKLCLPFSPYRQRPDITLHGREATRSAIETLVRATSSAGVKLALRTLALKCVPSSTTVYPVIILMIAAKQVDQQAVTLARPSPPRSSSNAADQVVTSIRHMDDTALVRIESAPG